MAKTKMSALKAPPIGLFDSTDPTQIRKGATLYDIPLDKLVPFKQNPFRLYEGQKLDDLIESIRTNGVLAPVIVRPIDEIGDDTKYEILSGHNRVNAAEKAGFEMVPAIIREGLKDEEALLIVTETNLLQRSFGEMTHSERAVALTIHHEAIKQQGRRADLIKEVEDILNASTDGDFETCSPMGTKTKSLEITGQEYALSKNTVARYLRVNKLIEPLKKSLDVGEFGIRAAVALSYLPDDIQYTVNDILTSSPYKLDTKKAEVLRLSFQKKLLERNEVEQILAGAKKYKNTRPATYKLKHNIMSKYFSDMKPKEIEIIIEKALDSYFEGQSESK